MPYGNRDRVSALCERYGGLGKVGPMMNDPIEVMLAS
jgi:hypothetical protein